MSQIGKPRLTKAMSKHITYCKLRVIFQTTNTLNNYFNFTDDVPDTLWSNFVYKATHSPKLVRPTSISK